MTGTQHRRELFRSLRDWSLVALVMLLPAAVWPAIIGFMHVLPASDVYESCGVARRAADVWDGSDALEVETSVLPLSSLCSWDDGYTLELVPGWANPTLGFFAASLSLATAGALTGAVVSRRGGYDA